MEVATAAEHSVARQWSEAMLQAIRKDFARPTVHARNLFHFSIAMYDAWAAFDSVAEPFLLGKTIGGYTCPFNGIAAPADIHAARDEAISYAAYRVLKYRFRNSPGIAVTHPRLDSLMASLGYDTLFTITDYTTGSPAALGNYIAQSVIDFGLQDGSNEQNDYAYVHYSPTNPPMITKLPGDSTLIDPNRWQPLTLAIFIDQNGNIVPGATPKFLTPEWGQVTPFALTDSEKTIYSRGGYNYTVYHDPGPPPYIDTLNPTSETTEMYKWGFSLVSTWSSHLDPADGVLWDISPASIGNNPNLPQTLAETKNFYDLLGGGDIGTGYSVNPYTGLPYEPQIIPRGDYARVLAEFWADGPTSETPPGHWFTILNYVDDHPAFQKRWRGTGPVMDELEWDVKSYFALGGAVHDAAISAWGIKGWYDFIRPISALRWMAGKGQCSDSTLPHYSTAGIPLIPGYIELVQAGDTLEGLKGANIGKIKILAWRGSDSTKNPLTDVMGVGWILAEKWWPYQRPTFVTPPFAGYVSGHSTFSRAASELMTLLTGDEYFPGGMSEFHASQNQYLVFEDGPSVDVTLQWATYRDASDQCSLSRIWGGIHPPVDDIPGRLIGREVGINAFHHAEKYFVGQITAVNDSPPATSAVSRLSARVYPNPITNGGLLTVQFNAPVSNVEVKLYNILGQLVNTQSTVGVQQTQSVSMNIKSLATGTYLLRVTGKNIETVSRVFVVK